MYMKCIRRATRLDAAEICDLRLSEYKCAKEFIVVDPAAVEWDVEDDRGMALAAWDEYGCAIATMRGCIVRGRKEAEEKLEGTVPLQDSSFPALILGKGATRREYRNVGLNSALRYYFLLFALDSAVSSILGVVPTGAPRTNLMKSIGYSFYTPSEDWRTDVQSFIRNWSPTSCHKIASPTGFCGQVGAPPNEAAISKLWRRFS